MTWFKCRCTKALSHVNSCSNYYYTINLQHEVTFRKKRKKQKGRKIYYKILFSDFFDILGHFRNVKIYKFSRSMLIVGKLLTCLKRPVYRGLRDVMLIG